MARTTGAALAVVAALIRRARTCRAPLAENAAASAARVPSAILLAARRRRGPVLRWRGATRARPRWRARRRGRRRRLLVMGAVLCRRRIRRSRRPRVLSLRRPRWREQERRRRLRLQTEPPLRPWLWPRGMGATGVATGLVVRGRRALRPMTRRVPVVTTRCPRAVRSDLLRGRAQPKPRRRLEAVRRLLLVALVAPAVPPPSVCVVGAAEWVERRALLGMPAPTAAPPLPLPLPMRPLAANRRRRRRRRRRRQQQQRPRLRWTRRRPSGPRPTPSWALSET